MKISAVGGADASASADPLLAWQNLLHRSSESATADRREPTADPLHKGGEAVGPGRQPVTPVPPVVEEPPEQSVEELAAHAIGKLVDLSADEVLRRLRDGVRLDRLLAEHDVSPADLASALEHFLAGHRRLDVRA